MSQLNSLHDRPSMSLPAADIAPDDRESIPLTEAADQLVEQGMGAARAGHPHEAVKLLEQALAINPDHVEALLWRGGLSEANESLPYLEHAVALDPGNQRARQGLDWARQRVGLGARQASTPPPASPPQRDYRSATVSRPPQPAPVAPPVATRPIASGRSVATPASIPLAHPSAPALDIASMLGRGLSFMIEHPTVALIIAILLLGMLGTAAVARAGMTHNQVAPQATPVVLKTGASTAPSSAGQALPAASRAVTPTVAATPVANATSLEQAWNAKDWALSVLILDAMLRRTPNDATLTQKMFTAHYNYGVQLVRSERLAEAVAEFDKALAINSQDQNVMGERRFAQGYLDGSTALAKGDFAAAITSLRILYEGNPNYRSTKTRLYQAYVGYADALEKAGKRADAYLYAQKASRIDTQGQEALAALTRLKDAAPVVSAEVANKKIEVDIARQQVIVWDNGKAIYRFKASTGKAPGFTRTGEFEILNKLPNAYSSSMQWGMPYWMGIYQAGGSENGFHAMARLANGTVLSTSVLGRQATNGCIMLSDADERTLYNWAVIGTPVWIH